jgi:uncharacterized protein
MGTAINVAENRIEAAVDGALATLVFEVANGRLFLMHTEVPTAIGQHGVGSLLVAASVDYAAEHRLTIVPICPFARTWLLRHPEAGDRVEIDWQTRDLPQAG